VGEMEGCVWGGGMRAHTASGSHFRFVSFRFFIYFAVVSWAWREFREIFREIWGGFQENEINEINAKFGGVPREIFFAPFSFFFFFEYNTFFLILIVFLLYFRSFRQKTRLSFNFWLVCCNPYLESNNRWRRRTSENSKTTKFREMRTKFLLAARNFVRKTRIYFS
jgi:hypothetical protein